jgi:hypothetical protein
MIPRSDDFDSRLFVGHHHDRHHGGGGSGGGPGGPTPDGGGSADRKDGGHASFAEGTSDYPTPIQGLGGALTAAATGGNVSTLTPLPKTGFVGQLNHAISGSLTIGTVGTNYTIPLHRLIQNYNFQNSLAYPYRSLNGLNSLDDLWLWANINQGYTGGLDSIYGSKTLLMPPVTGLTTAPFQFTFTDWIALNDGINFSKYLLSALTNSNDLTLLINWLPAGSLNTALQAVGNTAAFTAYTASDAVSCVYDTVPDPDKYYWPNTKVVQQVIGDPSFSQTAQGINSINLTPISGPDFMGLGIQVQSAGGVVDPLTPNGSGISLVRLLVGGSIPLKVFTLSDLIRHYEMRFGRQPNYGYLYLDMTTDLGTPNTLSNVMRKALATTKYAQLTVEVTLNANYTAGAGGRIVLLKRTQQQYSGNAAIA